MTAEDLRPLQIHKPGNLEPVGPRRTIHHVRWYIQPLRRWSPVILVLVLLAGVGTYLFETKAVKPLYQSVSTEEVDVPPTNTVGSGIDILNSQEYASTAAPLIRSLPVATIALALLKGYVSSPATHRSLYADMGGQPASAPVARLIDGLDAHRVLGRISVNQVPNSQDLSIAATGQNPVFAALISNAVDLAGATYEEQLQAGRYSSTLSNLQKQISVAQSELNSWHKRFPKRVARARSLQNAITNLQTTYATTSADESLSAIRFLPSIPATVPTSTYSPHPVRVSLIAGLAVLVVLVGGLVLREYFATTLRTPDEVSEALGDAPVLGAVLRHQATGAERVPSLSADPRSPAAEGLRVIRTNLLFANVDKPPRSILFTSARQGEGKTTIASNLAASMAELGGRVLLIDADLRRPSLGRVFGLDARSGLTNALVAGQSEPLDGFIRKVDSHAGLSVMASGPVPPNPAELLSSSRMRELMRSLEPRYDAIIIDSPPLLAVADPAILSTMVEAVILVADVNQATLQSASRTREALEQVGSRVTGVVLNKLSDNQRGSYYYGYYYRNEYGYPVGPGEGPGDKSAAGVPSA